MYAWTKKYGAQNEKNLLLLTNSSEHRHHFLAPVFHVKIVLLPSGIRVPAAIGPEFAAENSSIDSVTFYWTYMIRASSKSFPIVLVQKHLTFVNSPSTLHLPPLSRPLNYLSDVHI